jgi:HCOMODA/2-hydroxy-3-carboxy-muconic semialdehyde decarboxylase
MAWGFLMLDTSFHAQGRRALAKGSEMPGLSRFGIVALAISVLASAASAQSAPAQSSDPRMAAAVAELVTANHVLAQEGIMPTYGHISMRSPLDPGRILISRALAPGLVTAEDIVELDLDCKPVVMPGPLLYQERFIHCAVYKARPDVGAIVHSHTPYLIAFSVTDVPLRAVTNSAQMMGAQPAPVFDASAAGLVENNLVTSAESGRSLAEKLGQGSIVLMRGHGSTVVAKDVPSVVTAARAMELNAMILLNAKLLGGNITYLNPKDYGNERIIRDSGMRDWDALKAKAPNQ